MGKEAVFGAADPQALRQHEAGTPVVELLLLAEEVCRTGHQLLRLKQFEAENRKLKQLVADLSLDKKMLQDVLPKKP